MVGLLSSASRPKEWYHYFGDQGSLPLTVPTSTPTITMDSGQAANCINIGNAMVVDTSPMGSGVVANASPVGTSYFSPTVLASERIVYMAAEFRFSNAGSPSSMDCSFGMIAWDQRSSPGTVNTSTHLVISMSGNTAGVQCMVNGAFINGAVPIGGPWTISVQDSNWHTVEWATDAANNAMVVALDGTVFAFTDSHIGSIAGKVPCWEPFYGTFNANRYDPEYRVTYAATESDLRSNESDKRHVNRLLKAGGYGPIGAALPAIATLRGADVAVANNVTTSFGHTAATLLFGFPVVFNSNTPPALESGFTDLGINAGLNTIAGRPQTKLAAGTSAETLTFASGQAATHCGVVGLDNAQIGAVDKNLQALANISVPSLTLQDTRGVSRILYGYVTRATLGHPPGAPSGVAAPVGSTLIAYFDNPSTGGDIALYLTDGGVASWAGVTLATGTAAGFYTFAAEVKTTL